MKLILFLKCCFRIGRSCNFETFLQQCLSNEPLLFIFSIRELTKQKRDSEKLRVLLIDTFCFHIIFPALSHPKATPYSFQPIRSQLVLQSLRVYVEPGSAKAIWQQIYISFRILLPTIDNSSSKLKIITMQIGNTTLSLSRENWL